METFEPYFKRFYIDNKLVKSGKEELIPKPINDINDITLKSFENNFAIEYGHADFRTTHKEHSVQFRLKNYDDVWHDNNGNKANYFGVPPGTYVFQVRASNINGIKTEKSLAITVLPPWYKTYWAFSIYFLLFWAAIYGINRYQKERIIKKEREKSRAKELEQAKEVEKAYKELKNTQAQLIQSEKMASLGELTAGIAHEIQNPLNFVNNFSEVSSEMLEEMDEELEKGELEEVKAISADLKQNLEKINHHGNRASSIVKGMLEHSRTSTGTKELTDINALADEYLRLAYHGLRAKEKDFNAEMVTNFDANLPKIEVIPQDIGRVLLNLINNAFQAVDEASRTSASGDYKPTVTISTQHTAQGQLLIAIKDNGPGIPDAIKDKIFQPFFTTKDTGKGTGLGLSLAYDIVKAHGGELSVRSLHNEQGSEFIIHLPMKSV